VSSLQDPGTNAPSGTTFTLTNLFPFTNGYTFYTGGCTGADPSKAIPTYFSSYPGRVILPPGTVGNPIDVFEPSVKIVVQNGTTKQSNVPVWAYPTNTGCDGTRIYLGVTKSDGTGSIQYDGLPFGNYTLCAYRSGSTARRATTTVNVNSTSGVTAPTLSLSSTTRACGQTAPDSNP